MIRYEKHQNIDKNKWDECISNSYNGVIYAYSWYLDTVCPEWDAMIDNDYIKVFPLTWRKKSGIYYLYQPCFTQQLGIFSSGLLTPKDTELFLKNIPLKFRYAEINLNIFNKTEDLPFRFIPQKTHLLDLIESYDKIALDYSTNLKRNLKTAEKQGLSINVDVPASQIIKLFSENRGKQIATLGDDDYAILENLFEKCSQNNMAVALGVYDKDSVLCAGAIFIASHSKVIFLFSGTSQEARNTGAMHFLIDHFIRKNAQRNLTLDFEGSNDSNLARFYKSFGAKECTYMMFVKNDLPWVVSKGVKFIKRLRKIADS
jgi:lipid II:glycine glycyltransferase (peptidoglycan interpeptide bridge formation enzyme)